MEKINIDIEALLKVTQSQNTMTEPIEEIIQYRSKELFGDNHKHRLSIKLFDGFGISQDENGVVYYVTFPRFDFATKSKPLASSIREFMGIDEKDPITITDIIQSYCEFEKL